MQPNPDRAAARALGAALRRLDYSEDELFRLLGDEAYSGGEEAVPVHARRLPATRLATAVRLLFLELPVPVEDAERALGQRGVDALAATGLAEVGAEVVPRARVSPVARLLLASDGHSRGVDDPADYVATYSPTSRICDSLTPRPRVGRTLDVGTGPGVHALLAAAHSEQVVATDVNPRALAFTELNAALNGIANVETRRGGLFEPVAGEVFELIVCNAPFVVSPESRWAYRDGDGGFHGDEVSERVVAGAAAHLAEGGYATLLGSWVATDEDAPDERPLAWAAESGCDAWILSFAESDPLEHAAVWNAHLTGDPEAYGAALDEWTSYFEELGARRISEGAMLLHRRPGARRSTRVDAVDTDELEVADEQIRRAFAARARLAGLRRREDLLGLRIAPARALAVELERRPRRRGSIRLDEGTRPVVSVSAGGAEVAASFDGRRTLGETLDRATPSGPAGERLRREVLRVARELLELGAARVR